MTIVAGDTVYLINTLGQEFPAKVVEVGELRGLRDEKGRGKPILRIQCGDHQPHEGHLINEGFFCRNKEGEDYIVYANGVKTSPTVSELQRYKEALQYFVDTFGDAHQWTASGIMQVHRGEALKLAEKLGVVPNNMNLINREENMYVYEKNSPEPIRFKAV